MISFLPIWFFFIPSNGIEEHENHIDIVCRRLKEFSLYSNLSKCVFGQTEIEFLGHLINKNDFQPTRERVQAISAFKKPHTINDIRRLLGLVKIYRRNIPHAAQIQQPLNAYLHDTRKNDTREIVWTPSAD